MRKYAAVYLTFAILMVMGALLTVHGQVGPTPPPPAVFDVTKIAAVAVVVAAVLQGVKKFVPALGGIPAVLINILLSLATAYATNPTLDVQFFITALGAALGSAGVHSFLRPAGVASTGSPMQAGKGS